MNLFLRIFLPILTKALSIKETLPSDEIVRFTDQISSRIELKKKEKEFEWHTSPTYF